VLTVTLAVVDWVMSIDPHWYSTIFGLIFVAGQALQTLAAMVLVLILLAGARPLRDVVTRDDFHDLGNLLLAFTLVWAYMQFSQFLIIWMGNIQEETPYYFVRVRGLWGGVALAIVIFHFAVPFLLLLTRQTKRSLRMLGAVAGVIVVLRYVDYLWIVLPMFEQGHHAHATHPPAWQQALAGLMLLAAPVGIGGIWVSLFIRQLARRPLVPEHDPRLREVRHGVEDFHTHHDPDEPGHPVHAVGGPA
jgi:hypothetical protein